MTSTQIETNNNNDGELKAIIALVKEAYQNRPSYGSTSIVAIFHSGRLANLKSGREVLFQPSSENKS
jgi:hypothetical protein